MGSFLRRWPRLGAAVAFGATGCTVSILWWTPIIFRGNFREWVLFVGTPGLSALVVGCMFGHSLLARQNSGNRAALWGAGIASMALLLFAPVFSTTYLLLQPKTEHWDFFGLTVIILIGSIVAVWWLVAIVGAVLGWVLYRTTLPVD